MLLSSTILALHAKVTCSRFVLIHKNLGSTYTLRIEGDPTENINLSITHFEEALSWYTFERTPKDWAEIQHDLGIAYSRHLYAPEREVNLRDAIKHFNQSATFFTKSLNSERWANIQGCLGVIHHDLAIDCFKDFRDKKTHHLKLAINHCRKALNTLNKFKSHSSKIEWANIQNNLGNIYRDCNQEIKNAYVETDEIKCFLTALEVYSNQNLVESWAETKNNLGLSYRQKLQFSEAINSFKEALRFFTPENSPLSCLQVSRNLGQTAFSCNIWDVAIQGFDSSIKSIERIRTWIAVESRRQGTISGLIEVYEQATVACVNNNQLEKALEYVERSRSKRLVDLIASNDLYQTDEISPQVKPLLEQFETLQQQIDQERNQHSASSRGERSPSSKSRAAFEAYSEAIAQLESEKQTIWQAIRKHDPVLAGQIQVEALSFEQIQNLIDQPTTAILSLFTTSTDTYIFVVRQNKLTLHTCPEQGLETFQNWIVENWSKPYVEDSDQWESQLPIVLENLAQRLQIRDLIEQHLQDIEELIIVPHLFLHQIPFAALPIDDGEYLGDRFLIRHIPSCQILQFCQNRPAVPEPLVYGTVENATDDLPCASFEGAQLSELFGISDEHRLKGSKQATVENFRNLAKAVNVLHCSHHAGSRLDDPLHSELLLANGSITLGQLLTPGWRLPQLSDVFLSCCETHLGTPTPTDDILTLATGFLCAGARSVVSTLWLVDDLATALFAIFYYEQRHQGCDRPMALQNAQNRLRYFNNESLKGWFNQADAKRQQLRQERDLHPIDSATYQALNGEYESYTNVALQLYPLKNSNKEFPFSHPFYWAGFR